MDLRPDDRFFWYSTTGWMMWNLLIGGLLVGTTILLYDGNPGYPDMDVLWKLAQESGMTCFGTSAGYITACIKAGIRIGSSDIYRVIESLPEVLDSLVVGVEQPNGGYYMPLFVVLRREYS